jgi:hypothetical protein
MLDILLWVVVAVVVRLGFLVGITVDGTFFFSHQLNIN